MPGVVQAIEIGMRSHQLSAIATMPFAMPSTTSAEAICGTDRADRREPLDHDRDRARIADERDEQPLPERLDREIVADAGHARLVAQTRRAAARPPFRIRDAESDVSDRPPPGTCAPAPQT